MLRLLVLASIGLTAGFAVVAGLLAHEWGWSEYASDELYVVYSQHSATTSLRYYVIRADGNNAGEVLQWDDEIIRAVACSPDGRTLTFSTWYDLYVMTDTGMSYSSQIDQTYNVINVANDGTVSFSAYDRFWIADPTQITSLAPPIGLIYGLLSHAVDGLMLWTTDSNNVFLTAEDGTLLREFQDSGVIQWIDDEQSFVFFTVHPVDRTVTHYIMDTNKGNIVQLNNPYGSMTVYSPDGVQAAIGTQAYAPNSNKQLGVFDTLRNTPLRELTDDIEQLYEPRCFLTFRPEMLIDQSQ